MDAGATYDKLLNMLWLQDGYRIGLCLTSCGRHLLLRGHYSLMMNYICTEACGLRHFRCLRRLLPCIVWLGRDRWSDLCAVDSTKAYEVSCSLSDFLGSARCANVFLCGCSLNTMHGTTLIWTEDSFFWMALLWFFNFIHWLDLDSCKE